MKTQIVVMHGGKVFTSRKDVEKYIKNKRVTLDDFKLGTSWREGLGSKLFEGFDLIYPKMPNKEDAKYTEWKLWFEKLIPFLEDNVILIGHSLGGLFFVKYLSENKFSKKIKALFLIAAPYEGKNKKQTLGTFALKKNFTKLTKQVGSIHIYHSKEDPVVPFEDFERYEEKLPDAHTRVFEGKGHFNDKELPELVEDIKAL